MLPAGGHSFVDIKTSGVNTCALKANGTLWCWGHGGHGQIGDGASLERLTPTQVVGQTFSSFDLGAIQVCGIATSGKTFCWGYNAYGAVGDGTTIQRALPTPIYGDYEFSQVAAGGESTGSAAIQKSCGLL